MTAPSRVDLERDLQGILRGVSLRRRGAALAVWGEAGMGKSHLAGSILHAVAARHFTFQAVVALPRLLAGLPETKLSSVWTDTVLDKIRAGEGMDAQRVAQVLGHVLSVLAPVVVCLEDVHEAPPDRLALLTALAEVIQRRRGIGLIITSRLRPPAGFDAYTLQPLNPQEFRDVLERRLPGSLPDAALTWIMHRTQGNPLFGLESLRSLTRQGHLWNDGSSWHWREPPAAWLPATLVAVLEERLRGARLDPAAGAVLSAASILPADAGDDLRAAVAGQSHAAFQEGREVLARLGIWNHGEFTHPLFREVARSGLPAHQRRELARRAVDALKDSDPGAAAAFVVDAALESDLALRLLLVAVERAEAAGDTVRAARWLASAAGIASGERRAELALAAAHGLRHADLPEAARLAAEASAPWPRRSEAVLLWAELLATLGRGSDAQQVLTQLPPAEFSGAELLGHQLIVLMLARDVAGASALWAAHPILRDTREPAALIAGLRALISMRQLSEAREVLARAAALASRPEDQLSLGAATAALLLQSGDAGAAADQLDGLAPRLLAAGNIRAAAAARHNQAVATERLGRLADAAAVGQQAASLYASVGDMRGYATIRAGAAWDHWHLGDYHVAEALLQESRDILLDSEPSNLLVECEGFLCLLYLDWSPPLATDLASFHAQNALEAARTINDPVQVVASLYDVGMVRIRQGRHAEALALSEEMRHLGERHHLDGLARDTLCCRALALEGLGQPEEALRLLRQAVEWHASQPDFYTRILSVEVARLTKDVALARALLDWFAERGMQNNVQLIRRTFPALEAGPGSTPAGLATRETSTSTRLLVLGPMQLRREGVTASLRGAQRQGLLALLLAARLTGQQEVPRSELLDTLYPQVPEPQASASLRDVVYQVRGQCGNASVLTTDRGYALGELSSDAEDFLASADTRLWRAPLFDGIGLEGGLEPVREVLHTALYDRALALINTTPVEAARLGRVLLATGTFDLRHLRLTLQALRAGGNHRSLGREYDAARSQFLEVGEHLPAHWREFLEARSGTLA